MGVSLDRARRRSGDPCRIGTEAARVLRRPSPERGYGARVRASDHWTVSRRLRAVVGALLVAAAASALTACGGGDAKGSDGATRTIVDAGGTKVEVPALPQRVVTLGEATLDGALAVGLRPIATSGGRGQGGISPYLDKAARGVIDVGVVGRPDLEHVAALKPDLIVVDDTAVRDGAVLGRLRRLAPTVRVSRSGRGWRAAFTVEADALNRQKEGAHVLHELDVRVRQVRDALGANAGARISVARWSGVGRPSVPADAPADGRVLDDLGLARRPDLDGDWIFLATPGTAGASDERAARKALARARARPGLPTSKAVRRGRVVPVDGSTWLGAGGPIAEREVLDDLARALTSG
jgi:iron complex transport system substrate-binding protein